MKKIKLVELDNVIKILLVILVVAISYFLVFLMLKPFFAPRTMMDMMSQIGGWNSVNLISLIIALIIGVVISFYLFKPENKGRDRESEFNIIKKVLSEDEKEILDEVKKARGITQDSLRFRLNWSKAKISTILTNLDKKGIVQRERTGKTYRVYLEKQFKTV